MGIQTMGSEADGTGNNGKETQLQRLGRNNSMYSLTLDEVQSQLGDLGKPLSSMNLDELLKNVFTAESALQRQGSNLSLTDSLSSKTVDEVWRDIQQTKINEQSKPTLGEMTLEDFLVKAGVVGVDPDQLAPQTQWMQQYQHPQQAMMGVYMSQPMPHPHHMYPENQLSTSMGILSDVHNPAPAPVHIVEKTVERRQKRMIKNRESAARSRARKQAYTNELENKVSRLEEENERLRKRKDLEKMLPCVPLPEPKYQLRRTASAPF
ncbi:ABSCISIC ACID-INSENSITIVE 5-like protein 2 [Mercurialis annua]|uniref:ABSCISIC ACID-INSENSITIVE 5-like protein 2 n=1 Tax=Mercurialis annua TaxID=3986 RepID=UPI00215F9FAF|nr:ABSCISIC ACID-INSENSITIVE 5-like protein 2 [Mercurialis annua]XP_050210835.1 ABSCISIC ACID-INSENSITIVE 5-like protein 2 [Mercurialis annua]